MSCDPAERRRTPLAEKLAERIRRTGPITVAEYVEACLHDPEHGYYRAHAGIRRRAAVKLQQALCIDADSALGPTRLRPLILAGRQGIKKLIGNDDAGARRGLRQCVVPCDGHRSIAQQRLLLGAERAARFDKADACLLYTSPSPRD